MPALSTWPPFPGPDRPTTLDTDTQAFFDHLGGTFTTEVNALADYLANAARPAYSVMATFDGSATSDADPGAGKWRLNNATQNAATVVYADLADANGADMTAIIEAIDDSTSSTKGWLRFSVNGDRTKWLLARVTGAITTATGYRKIPITVIASSAASPMTNADEITVAFTPNGDKGDGAIWSTFASPTLTGSSITLQASIPANSNDLKFDFDAVTSTGGSSAPTISLSADGSSFSTAIQLTNANVLRATGTVNIRHHRANIMVVESALVDATLTSPAGQTASPIFIPHKISGGAIAVRFAWTGGDTFAGGGALTAQSR